MDASRRRKRYDASVPTLYFHKARQKYFIAFYNPTTHTRQWQGTGTAILTEAEAKLRTFIQDTLTSAQIGLTAIATTAQTQTTINQCLDLWAEEQVRQTKPGDRGRLPALSQLPAIRTQLGAHRVSALTLGILHAARDAWVKQGYAPATINRRIVYVRQACRIGYAHHLILRVPTFPVLTRSGKGDGWPMFDESDNVREGLVSPEELARVCAAESEPAVRDLYVFAYWTGMRWGGICGLTWDGFDPRTFSLRLHPRSSKNKQGLVYRLPPGSQLYALIARRYAQRTPGAKWVFEIHGAHLATAHSRWTRAWQRAGLDMKPGPRNPKRLVPVQVFHDLRRTGVTNLINAGVPEKVAMMISGHRSNSMFRRYNIQGEAAVEAALEKVSTQLGPVPTLSPIVLSPRAQRSMGQRSRLTARRTLQLVAGGRP